MATLTVRNIDDEAYERLKARAKAHRRSVTQEAAIIIERALEETSNPTAAWNQTDRVRERIRNRYGSFPDSTDSIRADRDR
jgi:plasmid stability protein